MDGVPVTSEPQTVKCASGAVLTVRRVKRSQIVRVMEAAGLKDGDKASEARFATLLVRTAVTAAEGLSDGGKPAAFRTEHHAGLKQIMAADLCDLLADGDMAAVIAAATEQSSLSEDAKGN